VRCRRLHGCGFTHWVCMAVEARAGCCDSRNDCMHSVHVQQVRSRVGSWIRTGPRAGCTQRCERCGVCVYVMYACTCVCGMPVLEGRSAAAGQRQPGLRQMVRARLRVRKKR
jgi:hypothetical protein